MTGIEEIADSISAELQDRLPNQRKTQRTKLALLVATMLDVRSANLMDLAAGLPRQADRTDMRYQWITRLLGNPLVVSDEIMEPFLHIFIDFGQLCSLKPATHVHGNRTVVFMISAT